jgi:hypothetical protein
MKTGVKQMLIIAVGLIILIIAKNYATPKETKKKAL